MFDVLLREVAARFGMGDKALPLVQMLLAYMTNKDTGGLIGFLEKFKAANLGPIVQSWLGGGPSAQPITNTQLETVLGGSGGLLSQLTSRLDVGRDNITSCRWATCCRPSSAASRRAAAFLPHCRRKSPAWPQPAKACWLRRWWTWARALPQAAAL